MTLRLLALIIFGAAAAAAAQSDGVNDMNNCSCSPAPPTLAIKWERLVDGGETCPRCGATGDEVDKAAAQLRAALTPLGVAVTYEKTELTLEQFKADASASNRVWLNGKLVEEWLGGGTGATPCCDVCGDEECRTVEVDGSSYEAVPADLIIKAGLLAAAALFAAPPTICCPGD